MALLGWWRYRPAAVWVLAGQSTPSASTKAALSCFRPLFFCRKMVQDASRAPFPSRWMTWGWRTDSSPPHLPAFALAMMFDAMWGRQATVSDRGDINIDPLWIPIIADLGLRCSNRAEYLRTGTNAGKIARQNSFPCFPGACRAELTPCRIVEQRFRWR